MIGNPPLPRAGRLAAALAAATAAGLTALAAAASPLVNWDGLESRHLRSACLDLDRPLELQISATATVGDEKADLVAYPWILDSESRKVAWVIDPDQAKAAGKRRRNQGTHLVKQETALSLPAGHYEVYFTTYGDVHRMELKGWPGISWGRIWSQHEPGQLEPDDWKLRITCRDADAAAVKVGEAACPRFNPLLRIAHPEPGELKRIPFRLDAPVSLVVYAIGEYDSRTRSMADSGWILRADTRERVWELTPENARRAGGAQKNRSFRDTVPLAAGTYILCYAGDDSHGAGEWNLNPPFDPEFWGIALFDHGGARAHFTANVEDPFAGNLLVALDRQPNSTFNLRGIRVLKPIQVRVIAIGEYGAGDERFADYGWIEEARTHRTVWRMTRDNTTPAGGSDKNRMADEVIALSPGDYLVCNWTDDSHAYGDWNAEPPQDPTGWGIQLWGISKGFDKKSVQEYAEDHDPRILAQLLGIGDDRHAVERFDVKQKVRARVLAVGEGTHGQMFDYGWLKRVDGPTVWRMRYPDTIPAGGTDKNRREEEDLELEPGAYELHYVTDDSHSFEDWNSDPPDQPHLWGVAVFRVN